MNPADRYRQAVAAMQAEYGARAREDVADWPLPDDDTVAMLKTAGYPLRPHHEDRGAA